MDIKLLRQTVEKLFTKRAPFIALCQEIAENFYPERAEFTIRREITDEFAGSLMTSYPVQVRRDFGDQTGGMLRPTAKEWFHMIVGEPEDKIDIDAKRWLEHQTKTMRLAMYERKSQFQRANKEADHDYVAFGQSPMSVRLNRDANGLLFRCWHIRDMVWMEDEDGENCLIARKWKPYAHDLKRLFGAKNAPQLEQKARLDPFCEIEVLHIVVRAEMYDQKANGKPYFSIYYDTTHDKVIEEVATWSMEYFIPQWQKVSGSQLALSPATITALPDARLIQSMAYTLLEAGEKIVNPPQIATEDVIRSDVALYAGGITWVDKDYDERLGEALRPQNIDAKGMPIGIELIQDSRTMLATAFYLNKLKPFVPTSDPQMTAFQAGQIVAQYIRDALPLFEPMEYERNAKMCEMTFEVMLRAGAFGSPFDMPKSLQGREINFRFDSPLHDAIEEQKGHKFVAAQTLISQALSLDRTAVALMDAKIALRDALEGIGTPMEWIRPPDEVDAMVKQNEKMQTAEQTLALAKQGADIAATTAGSKTPPAQAAM